MVPLRPGHSAKRKCPSLLLPYIHATQRGRAASVGGIAESEMHSMQFIAADSRANIGASVGNSPGPTALFKQDQTRFSFLPTCHVRKGICANVGSFAAPFRAFGLI